MGEVSLKGGAVLRSEGLAFIFKAVGIDLGFGQLVLICRFPLLGIEHLGANISPEDLEEIGLRFVLVGEGQEFSVIRPWCSGFQTFAAILLEELLLTCFNFLLLLLKTSLG